ncbi:serine/threonine-protein kinase [Myxococcota bacterium]
MLPEQQLPSLAPYRALASLGQGGVGHVYHAVSPTGAHMAIKVIHPEIASRVEVVEAILSNAWKTHCIDHPNLVGVHGVGRLSGGRPFIAMEHIAGWDLGELLAQETALPFTRVLEIGLQISAGLSALHQRGLLHLDLKPNNVRVLDSGHVKVLDLGLAATGNDAASLDLGPGTPEYWSPEHASRQAVDQRSDVYGLGVLMYEALTGRTPFSSHSVAEVVADHLYTEPARLAPPPQQPRIPEAVQNIVLRCLKKSPTLRFQTIDEVSAALEAAQEVLLSRSADGSSTWRRVTSGKRSSHRITLALVAITAAIAASGTFLGLRYVPAWLSPGHARTMSPEPNLVDVTVTSEPSGAYVYRSGGGRLLGRTPTVVEIAIGKSPVELVLRFPTGEKTLLTVVPDRPNRVHGVATSREE